MTAEIKKNLFSGEPLYNYTSKAYYLDFRKNKEDKHNIILGG